MVLYFMNVGKRNCPTLNIYEFPHSSRICKFNLLTRTPFSTQDSDFSLRDKTRRPKTSWALINLCDLAQCGCYEIKCVI